MASQEGETRDWRWQASDCGLLRLLVEEHRRNRLPRLEKLWDYYRNEMSGVDLTR